MCHHLLQARETDLGLIEDYKVMTEHEQAESVERGETSVETLTVDPEVTDGSVRVEADVPKG